MFEMGDQIINPVDISINLLEAPNGFAIKGFAIKDNLVFVVTDRKFPKVDEPVESGMMLLFGLRTVFRITRAE